MGAKYDLTGMRFGRLTVIGPAYLEWCNRSVWLCRCDCGGETTARGCDLRNGEKKSCGCLNRDHLADMRAKWARMREAGMKGGRHRKEMDTEAAQEIVPITDEGKARFTDWWMFGEHEGEQEKWFNRVVRPNAGDNNSSGVAQVVSA